jgi:hypothetical protein
MCLSVVCNAYTIVMGSSQVRLRTAAAVVCHPPLMATRPYAVTVIFAAQLPPFFRPAARERFSRRYVAESVSGSHGPDCQPMGRQLRIFKPNEESKSGFIYAPRGVPACGTRFVITWRTRGIHDLRTIRSMAPA